MPSSPYAKAPEAKLSQILRLAEARLEAQLTSAIAADQRAMTYGAILVGASAALIAVAVAMSQSQPTVRLIGPVLAMLFGLTVAAGMAIYSAFPTDWEIVGTEPRHWLEDIEERDTLHNGVAAMAEHYDQMITDNNARMVKAAWWMKASLLVTGLTLTTSMPWAIVAAL
jgi:hypothetical protein